jgi:chromosome segregation ATPase
MQVNQEVLHQGLINLERRIQFLLNQYKLLENENRQLKEENKSIKEKIKLKEEQIVHFQNQHKITKIVGSVAEESEQATELKSVINEYIKEIDKCLAHLTE